VTAISDPTVAAIADAVVTEYEAGGDVAQDGPLRNGELRHDEPDAAVATATATQAAAPVPQPAPPFPILRKRLVRGRYRSGGAGYQLELRVDVGGNRSMNRFSADFFYLGGGTESYFGSFHVDAPTITTTATEVRLEGLGTFTWAAGAPYVKVTIPRRTIFQPPAPATVQFVTPPSTPGASYTCAFASPYFRTVLWEQDSVAGAVPFVSYDTAALPTPAGSPSGVLDVPAAYRLAGIEVLASGTPNVIPVAAAGSDAKWTDAELHAAMVTHFSLWADVPQWKVWLLVATEHVGGYRGIMFDYTDTHQRQGCAVFYNQIQGSAPYDQRAQLRTYMHELGHCFNLLHSWQKNLADPPQPLGDNNGFGDLSWMNYTWQYQPSSGPGGDAAYWAAFPFQFTDNEVIHLRHGLYNNVVMGANPFGRGAAEVDPELFAAPTQDRSGLALEVRAKRSVAYGEPVVAELKLSSTDTRGAVTHGFLHPNDDFVAIAIRQPSGRTVLYRPMLRHCADEHREVRVDPDGALYESAYIGYGRDGAYFEQPGRYAIRAAYVAADGSRIVSPVTEVRVRPPVSAGDQEVGELLMGDEQGQLLALLGSDSEHLSAGKAALEELLDKHGDHPLATFARLTKGVNAARAFKRLTADKQVIVREPEPHVSTAELKQVEEASKGGAGVDNITLNMVLRTRARAEARAGDTDKAIATLDAMPGVFEAQGLKPQVIETVRRQAAQAKAELLGEG
jgi:hypothetical protein